MIKRNLYEWIGFLTLEFIGIFLSISWLNGYIKLVIGDPNVSLFLGSQIVSMFALYLACGLTGIGCIFLFQHFKGGRKK